VGSRPDGRQRGNQMINAAYLIGFIITSTMLTAFLLLAWNSI
jgi:hypothetical protein